MKSWVLGFLTAASLASVQAQDWVAVCHDYGCANESMILFSRPQLDSVADVMAAADSPEDERQRISLVIGQLYAWAGEESPIWQDRAGNS